MSNENLPPHVIKRIMKETMALTRNPPEDIKVCTNEDDITDIQAVITGPAGTPYEGGAFRIRLQLGSEFPQVPPKGWFLTKIFHPNVSNAGEICVNTLKKDWKENLGIEHVLLTIKCLLIVPNPESALNEEAGRLLLEAYDDYAEHARLMTRLHAKSSVVDDASEESTASSTAADATAETTKKAAAKKPKKVAKKRALKRL